MDKTIGLSNSNVIPVSDKTFRGFEKSLKKHCKKPKASIFPDVIKLRINK